MGRGFFLDIRMSYEFYILCIHGLFLFLNSSANPFTGLLQLLGAHIDMSAMHILPFLLLKWIVCKPNSTPSVFLPLFGNRLAVGFSLCVVFIDFSDDLLAPAINRISQHGSIIAICR